MDRNLNTFLMVAETENLTLAATRLHITQPTLTKRLQQLEQKFGGELVTRLPRGVKLTPLGEALLPYAQRIDETFLQAEEALKALKDGHLDELRVGAGPLFHLGYLGGALKSFRNRHPNIRVRLSADLNTRHLPKLRQGALDLMFGTTENLDEDDLICFDQLTEVEQGLLVSAEHPLATHDCVSPQDLKNLEWIVYSDVPENEQMTIAYFLAHGMESPHIALQTSSFSLGMQTVEGSQYAMTIPVQLASFLSNPKLKVLKVNPAISTKAAGAFYRMSSLNFPVVSHFIEAVRTEIASLGHSG